MPYPALPDRRIPYDNDGSIVGVGSSYGDWNTYQNQWAVVWAQGISSYMSGSDKVELNDSVYNGLASPISVANAGRAVWWFFPEMREVTAMVIMTDAPTGSYGQGSGAYGVQAIAGSNDSVNGVDGTWEFPSVTGVVMQPRGLDKWRANIAALSLTGGKKVIRIYYGIQNTYGTINPIVCHIYGEKVAGQTPDDVIYIDHDTTPGVEYAAPEDFGDQPLGTTVVRQFRLKNTSATKTANSINVQCNDSDFAISTDGTTWVVTINIASLGPGAQSSTMYVRCTTPAPGNLLGPRFARIVTTVASYT